MTTRGHPYNYAQKWLIQSTGIMTQLKEKRRLFSTQPSIREISVLAKTGEAIGSPLQMLSIKLESDNIVPQ
jgi:hypothetical protein